MTNVQTAQENLDHFATNISKWRTEAERLRLRLDATDAIQPIDPESLVQLERAAGDMYHEIASFKETVANIGKHSPTAANELAEVGEILHLLLLDIIELGTKMYSARSGLGSPIATSVAEGIPVSKRGSKSIGEDRRRDADALARRKRGSPPLPPEPSDEGRSSGHGMDGPAPPSKT